MMNCHSSKEYFMEQKYSAKFFREGLPEWKRKKDPFFIRLFYRPISYHFASFFANVGFQANDVTMISIGAVIISLVLFAIPIKSYLLGIWGAIFLDFWMLLDCVDGNMARCIKKQPFGDFLDAFGSYLLTAWIGLCIAINVYINGGELIVPHQSIILIIGGVAGISDLLMRVTHQKFLNNSRDYIVSEEVDKEYVKSQSLIERIKLEFGIGGIIPPAIIICAFAHALDLIVIYLTIYNVLASLVMISYYIIKALKYRG